MWVRGRTGFVGLALGCTDFPDDLQLASPVPGQATAPAATGTVQVEATPPGSAEPAPTVCPAGDPQGGVSAPVFLMNLQGRVGHFASPVVADLDQDGDNELVAAFYDLFVFDHEGNLLDEVEAGEGRIFSPHVVADLDGDGRIEIVAGNEQLVTVWEWRDGALAVEAGWPVDTTMAGWSPQVRSVAASDLDGDGILEIVAATTQIADTEDGAAQVFVFEPDGSTYQPAGAHEPAWPRYNNLAGEGNDADRNGMGHWGYGCYGLNVAIGELDDDPELEIVVTYDNHYIQLFDHDGVAHDVAAWYTNRIGAWRDQRLTWGQMVRWADPAVEEAHWHDHEGEWPSVSWTEWLQWSASPPGVVDLDGDGHAEIVAAPNVEKDSPYVTQAYALMVLQGSQDGGQVSGMRLPGWEVLPRGDFPDERADFYPLNGIPAVTPANVLGDGRPELAVPLNDGHVYLFDADANELWRYDHARGVPLRYASEVTVADLDQDGSPELLFATWGDPDDTDAGRLFVLSAGGDLLHEVALSEPGYSNLGSGAPAAPTVADLDGDGQLEVFVQTFDHGLDVFTVPGSAANCLLWPTARGGPSRTGAAR